MSESSGSRDGLLSPVQELDVQQALELAIYLQQQNRHDEAGELFSRILAVQPDHADALHYLGLVKYFLKETGEAIALIQKALAVAPDYLHARNNLGNLYLGSGQFDKALAAYRQVLEIDPCFKAAYNNLGTALRGVGRNTEAVDVLLKAIQLDPYLQMFYQNLGNIFREQDESEDAMEAYLEELRHRPHNPDTYIHLSRALNTVGERAKSVRVLRMLLEHEPENALARHTLCAYTGENIPPKADEEYVRQTFDRFADSFDSVLKSLDYQAPFLVEKALRRVASFDNPLRVLDAGCGTGLCGPLLRPVAGRLEGVDLSSQMLERARLRGVYDELVEAELLVHLDRGRGAWDVVVAADVFCYFGDLSAVLQAVAKALAAGGWLIFTVERLGDVVGVDCRLNDHGRYGHSAAYIENALAGAGFAIVELESTVLRLESGKPVEGILATAQRI